MTRMVKEKPTWAARLPVRGGDFTVSVETLPYPYLTATATNATKGTSEFSTVFTTTLPILASSTKTADKNKRRAGG